MLPPGVETDSVVRPSLVKDTDWYVSGVPTELPLVFNGVLLGLDPELGCVIVLLDDGLLVTEGVENVPIFVVGDCKLTVCDVLDISDNGVEFKDIVDVLVVCPSVFVKGDGELHVLEDVELRLRGEVNM